MMALLILEASTLHGRLSARDAMLAAVIVWVVGSRDVFSLPPSMQDVRNSAGRIDDVGEESRGA